MDHGIHDKHLPTLTCCRRTAFAIGGLVFAGSAGAISPPSLIRKISHETLWSNLDGSGASWFHPRACMVPHADGQLRPLMTLQAINGSDFFGPVHWTTAAADGRHWSAPQPIAAFDQRPVPRHAGLRAGVCDVVPEYHPPTNTVLAVGHVVFYRGERFSRGDQLARYPLYAVRKADGSWSERRRLEWDDPRGSFIYTNNCGQRIVLPDSDILLAFSFGPQSEGRSVAGVRCHFDGKRLAVKEVGPALTLPVGRGLLEPSVTTFAGRFFLTIRAEDGHGYVSMSDDNLHWQPQKAWSWDDGSPIGMSTTQQHWLTHSDGLFLVYTREDPANQNVVRWRSPLFVAAVDPDRLVLIRDSEQIVLPIVGDGVNHPDEVPLMGNFHVTNASPDESWVTVGSWQPKRKARGDTLLARICWQQPNRLVHVG